MKFVLETAPDPTSDVGVAGAQAYILEKAPEWIEKYGKNSAYFCTNDAHTEPLLKRLLEYGGYFIEADLPSPLMGYPGALGIDLTAEAGDFAKILAKVEKAVCDKGGAGRFGTWAYSYGYTLSAGLAEHAKNVIDGKSELRDLDDISKAFSVYTGDAEWNGSAYTNAETGVKSENFFLVYQDTYIMNKLRRSIVCLLAAALLLGPVRAAAAQTVTTAGRTLQLVAVPLDGTCAGHARFAGLFWNFQYPNRQREKD